MSAPATFLDLHKAQKRVARALEGLSLTDQRDVVLRVIAEAEAKEGNPAPSFLDRFRPKDAPTVPAQVPQCEHTDRDMQCVIYRGHTGAHELAVRSS